MSTNAQPSVPIQEVMINAATTADNLTHGLIKQMPHAKRYELRYGHLIELVAANPARPNQRALAGKMPLGVIRAAFKEIDQQLTNLETNGADLSGLTQIIVPVTSPSAFNAIIRFLDFNIRKAKGALGEMQTIPTDQKPLYQYMVIQEVAAAVGFKHVVDMMKQRIDRTLYRGGDHRYTLPIVDARAIWKHQSNTETHNNVKAKLVVSVVKSYRDYRLTKNKEVEKMMGEVDQFYVAVNAEPKRVCEAAKTS